MKILTIRGCNLASLAGDFLVDFEDGPLGRAGLFAISGPTGAGKSTLLDAICLALFDKTPRLSDGKSSFSIADVHDESIGVNDTRTILRRGASEGFAEVVFESSDGVRYCARWSVSRARKKSDGRLQPSTVNLVNVASGQSLGRTKGEVLDQIQKAIGLSFEQFRRSVLLAQGDFAAFLQAKGDDRAALLERMTGTEIFTELGSRAYRRAEEERKSLEAKEDEQRGIELLSPADRVAAEAQLKALVAEIESNSAETRALRAGEAWWKASAGLQLRLDEAEQHLNRVELEWDAAAGRREALAEIEAVQPLRANFDAAIRTANDAKRAAEQVEVLTSQLAATRLAEAKATESANAAADALDKARSVDSATSQDRRQSRLLDARILERRRGVENLGRNVETTAAERAEIERDRAALEARRTDLRGARDASRSWLQTNVASVELARTWNTTFRLLSQYSDRQKIHLVAIETTEQAKRQLAIDEMQLIEAEAKWLDTKTTLDAAHANVGAAEAAERSQPEGQMRKRNTDVRARALAVDRLKTLQELAIESEGRRSRKASEAAAADAEAIALAAKIRDQTATFTVAGRQLAEVNRQIEVLDLAARRAKLVDGEPCPLCGSKEHPGVGPIDVAVNVLATQRVTLEKEIEQAKQAEARHQSSAEGLTRNAMAARVEAETVEVNIARFRSEWIDVVGKLALGAPPDPLSDDARRFVAQQAAAVQWEVDELNREEAHFNALRKAAEKARREREGADKAERGAKSTLDAVVKTRDVSAEAVRTAEQQRHHALATLEGLVSSLTSEFAHDQGWAVALEADPVEFVHRCQSRVDNALKQNAILTEAERELSDLDAQVAVATASLERLGRQFEATRVQHEARRRELHADEASRGLLLGGRSVDEFEASIRGAIDGAEKALKAHEAATSTATSARLRDEGLLASASSHAATTMQLANAAHQVLALAMSNAGLDRATLEARLEFVPTWITRERLDLQNLEKERATAADRVASRRTDRAAHAATECPTQSLADILAGSVALDTRNGVANQELGAVKNRIGDDDRNRLRAAALGESIEEMRRRNTAWAQLSDVIGSADGKKFRTFAQSLTLDLLLAHANGHLADLAPRYRLQRVPALDLELQMVDCDMGDEVRATNSLSGGETFLVSLAMALGLSSLASERVRIDSLFIDEGFGSLDSQTMESALATLDALQAAGRKVGLISHVPGLAERIGVQVLVEKHGNGRSSVQIVSA